LKIKHFQRWWLLCVLIILVASIKDVYRFALQPAALIDRVACYILEPWYRTSRYIAQKFQMGCVMVRNYGLYQERYQQAISQYQRLLADYAQLYDEVNRLRSWWGLAAAPVYTHSALLCLARVMIIHEEPGQRWIMIDRGAGQGVVPEALFVVDGVLVGVVTQVFDRCSRVVCIGDRSSGIPVCSIDRSYTGVAVGNNNQIRLLDIMYIPHTATPCIGDILVCSGQGNRYPAGLAVARIVSCHCNLADVTHTVQAEPLVKLTLAQVGAIIRPLPDGHS
jgi:rod shape-determining protein MreC